MLGIFFIRGAACSDGMSIPRACSGRLFAVHRPCKSSRARNPRRTLAPQQTQLSNSDSPSSGERSYSQKCILATRVRVAIPYKLVNFRHEEAGPCVIVLLNSRKGLGPQTFQAQERKLSPDNYLSALAGLVFQ
jgi:hypothetical protein